MDQIRPLTVDKLRAELDTFAHQAVRNVVREELRAAGLVAGLCNGKHPTHEASVVPCSRFAVGGTMPADAQAKSIPHIQQFQLYGRLPLESPRDTQAGQIGPGIDFGPNVQEYKEAAETRASCGYVPLLAVATPDVSRAEDEQSATHIASRRMGHPQNPQEPKEHRAISLRRLRAAQLPDLPSLVLSQGYDVVWCSVTMLHTMWIGVQTDYKARHWSTEGLSWTHIQYFFLAFYVIDIGLRLMAFRKNFFCWFWNNFDFAIVLLQIAQETKILIPWMSSAWSPSFSVSILRMIRTWRVIRNVRCFEKLRTLLYSILKSLSSLMWLMLLLLLLAFCFGVVITQVVTSHKLTMNENNEDFEKAALEEYFGTLTRTIGVLYKAGSDGLHWGEVADTLSEFCSPWLGWLFAVYMSFVLFAVMNVMTASFIDVAMHALREERQQRMSQELSDMFQDSAMPIDKRVFDEAMNEPEMLDYLSLLGITPIQAGESNLFGLIDEDGSGTIDPSEIVSGCMRLTGPAKAFDVACLMRDFRRESAIMESHRHQVDVFIRSLQEAAKRRNGDSSDVEIYHSVFL